MLVVIWLLVTSHHLVPGWSLAGLWLVSGWSYLRTDFHNVCQSVSPGVTGCDIEHNKQKTVITTTTTTTTCHPQAVAEMSRKLWGREASCLCLRTREKLRAWELPVLSWRVSPARHWLLANKDITGVTGRQEEERRASTSKLWAATFPSVLGLFMILTFKPTSVEQIQRYKMLSDEGIS